MRATFLARAHAVTVALLLASTAACNDMLIERPKATIVSDNYFQTAADAQAAIAAAYAPLSGGNLFSTDLQWGLNAASDESRVGPEEENVNIVSLTQLAWTPTNPYVAGSSSSGGTWAGLYQMITRANLVLEKVPAIKMDTTVKTEILGEAKFLRALGYHYLVRLYGDVPIVTNTKSQLASATGARAPAAQVYAQIEKDATDAEAALPLSWSGANKGRATKGAAEALLAEHYLWKQDWTDAAAEAKKVIDSKVYALVPDYLQAFLPGSENRSEEIFAAQSSSATGAPSISIVYWTYPRAMDPNTYGGWGTYQPLPWFINSFIPGDYRAQVDFFTSGPAPTGRDTTFAPHIHKFRPSVRPGREDENWPIYRYADVLLMYAEALNELGNPDQAIPYVNQVRARARNGTGSENRAEPADIPLGLSQPQARDSIFQERQWELAFEGKRWFDMVRRGWPYFQAALSRDPTATNVVQTRMLWPIPQPQIDLDPQLTQNPGY